MIEGVVANLESGLLGTSEKIPFGERTLIPPVPTRRLPNQAGYRVNAADGTGSLHRLDPVREG